ncbi:unnamed protein product [Lupinus luteus]|uniref:Uncharacterized protein n=1 Tax=Lupinus luteus TaxID=3873 RepID=A0AAV1Y1E7_LUPLU
MGQIPSVRTRALVMVQIPSAECSLSELLKELAKRVHAARYEDLIIRLATAYDDFIFYLSAFMDFRGRSYRSYGNHRLDRKLIKRLFMPLIYGKTLISMNNDIRVQYENLLSPKDSYNLAKLSNDFWSNKYPDIANLMKKRTIPDSVHVNSVIRHRDSNYSSLPVAQQAWIQVTVRSDEGSLTNPNKVAQP